MATQLNGRWQARLRRKGQKPLVWYGATEEEAEAEKARYIASLSTSSSPAPSTTPLVTAPDPGTLDGFTMFVWWPGIEATAVDNTKGGYLSNYRTWIGPSLGHMRLNEIRREDVQSLVNSMIERGKAPGTIRNVRRLLSQILNDALDEDIIGRNPARRVRIPQGPGKRLRSLPPSQVNEILDGTAGPLRCACYLAMLCGLRQGEISGLSWDRIDRRGKTLTVDRQHVIVSRKREEMGKKRLPAILKLMPTKSKKTRIIALPQSMIDAIDALGNLDSPWVVSDDGPPISPGAIGARWGEIRDRLGFPEFTFHDLRHVAAGLLHGQDAGDILIRDTLGHSKLDMTHMYVEVAMATQRAALERVAASVVDEKRRRDVDELPPVASI